jgi:hypothetical protein
MKDTQNKKDPFRISYQAALVEYCAELENDSKRNASVGNLLVKLDNLLDRCLQLESPQREHLFVDEVCRMGRALHLAA